MTPSAVPNVAPRFACGYVLTFSDGGKPEERVLHIGTREECERTMSLVTAISYSGTRPNPRAEAMIVEFAGGES